MKTMIEIFHLSYNFPHTLQLLFMASLHVFLPANQVRRTFYTQFFCHLKKFHNTKKPLIFFKVQKLRAR